MVYQHSGKPFVLHHINQAFHWRVIPDRCPKVYAPFLCAGEVLKCVRHKTVAASEGLVDNDSDKQKAMDYWIDCIRDWYPDRFTQTNFCPSLHFNRLPYSVLHHVNSTILVREEPGNPAVKSRVDPVDGSVAGHVYLSAEAIQEKKRKVQASDVDDSKTVEYLRTCLQELFHRLPQVMMVILGLDFRDYLSKDLDNARATVCRALPRPASMPDKRHHKGDFDLLIIHRHLGLIVGEIKSVGTQLGAIHDLGASIVKRVRKAVDQLRKEQEVLRHLVSDMASELRVTTTLILPAVTSQQVKEALCSDPHLEKAVCECLGVEGHDISAALRKCLCKDQMPSEEVLRELKKEAARSNPATDVLEPCQGLAEMAEWWRNLTETADGADPCMTDTVYEHLLARFCGEATLVEVPTVSSPYRQLKTQGQAVAETGLHFSILSLYPHQVELLNDPKLTCVHLYGPPGTGKTWLAVLKACSWLSQGHDVHVLSARKESRAVAYLIEGQLNLEVEQLGVEDGERKPRVFLHALDFTDNDQDLAKAIDVIASSARDNELYVIADEVLDMYCRTKVREFCEGLQTKVDSLCLWTTGMEKLKTKPPWLVERALTKPLRSPPNIYREVAECKEIARHRYVPSYSTESTPATQGPDVVWLHHRDQGHQAPMAEDCTQCGEAIVQQLRTLRVGTLSCVADLPNTRHTEVPSGEDRLQFRDVLILCHNPRDTELNAEGEVMRPPLAIVQVLRDHDIPVTVLSSQSTEQQVRDVARAVEDHVTVTHYDMVSGLERRVVVGMGREGDEPTSASWKKPADADTSRLHGMSRCSGLLIWIDDPSD